jgi:hypothetical protein
MLLVVGSCLGRIELENVRLQLIVACCSLVDQRTLLGVVADLSCLLVDELVARLLYVCRFALELVGCVLDGELL